MIKLLFKFLMRKLCKDAAKSHRLDGNWRRGGQVVFMGDQIKDGYGLFKV